MAEQAGDDFLWTVPVVDPLGRQREFKIGIRGDQVVVSAPPGEGFTLDPREARTAGASFTEAARRAFRNRRP